MARVWLSGIRKAAVTAEVASVTVAKIVDIVADILSRLRLLDAEAGAGLVVLLTDPLS